MQKLFRAVRRFIGALGPFLGMLLISGVLFSAAILKSLSFDEFKSTLNASQLVPSTFILPVAVTLVGIECLTGAGLLIPAMRTASLKMALVLFSVFVSYSTWRSIQGINAPCGCFGRIFKLSLNESIGLNMLLLFVVSCLLAAKSRSVDFPMAYRAKIAPSKF